VRGEGEEGKVIMADNPMTAVATAGHEGTHDGQEVVVDQGEVENKNGSRQIVNGNEAGQISGLKWISWCQH